MQVFTHSRALHSSYCQQSKHALAQCSFPFSCRSDITYHLNTLALKKTSAMAQTLKTETVVKVGEQTCCILSLSLFVSGSAPWLRPEVTMRQLSASVDVVDLLWGTANGRSKCWHPPTPREMFSDLMFDFQTSTEKSHGRRDGSFWLKVTGTSLHQWVRIQMSARACHWKAKAKVSNVRLPNVRLLALAVHACAKMQKS